MVSIMGGGPSSMGTGPSSGLGSGASTSETSSAAGTSCEAGDSVSGLQDAHNNTTELKPMIVRIAAVYELRAVMTMPVSVVFNPCRPVTSSPAAVSHSAILNSDQTSPASV